MCKGVCDTTTCTNHDYWYCQCKKVCFRCRQATKYSGNYCGTYAWSGLREKYVCFDCKHVWKHRWSKYIWLTDEGKKIQKKNFKEDHYNSWPACNICGHPGIHVGENFRHCKNDKQWQKLRFRYESGEIDMIKEFEGSAVRPKYLPLPGTPRDAPIMSSEYRLKYSIKEDSSS